MRTSLTRRRTVSAATAVAAAIVLAISALAPAPQPVAAQDAVTVEIVNFTFVPATLTIEVGTTVTWINQDAAPHTATGDNGEFDTGQLDSGQSGSITFTTPGTYNYHCEIHPSMTGTIVVVAADDGATDDGATDDDDGNDDDAVDDDDDGTGADDDAAGMPSTGIGFTGGDANRGGLAILAALGSVLFALGFVTMRRSKHEAGRI